MNKRKLKILSKKFLAVMVLWAMFAPGFNQYSLASSKTIKASTDTEKLTTTDRLNLQSSIKKSNLQFAQKNKNYKEGELIVKFKKDIDLKNEDGKQHVSNFAKQKNLNKIRDFRAYNASLLKVKDSKTSLDAKIKELKNDPMVEYVQPNYQYNSLSTNVSAINDTNKTNQWGLYNDGNQMTVYGRTVTKTLGADINAAGAWAVAGGENASVTVAVIDTGVAYNHPDLTSNMWSATAGNCYDQYGDVMLDDNDNPVGCTNGWDFENYTNDPRPSSSFDSASASHGTHVAGIIGAVQNNNKGISGVAKNVKIMALRSDLTTDSIVDAIGFAKYNGAKVINASWGGYEEDDALLWAIEDFGGLFVASAGNETNDNDTNPMYPCSYSKDTPNIICVAASDENDNLADFSNFGKNTVDIAAPGTDIYSSLATTSVATQDFSTVTPPALPTGWTTTKSGNASAVSGTVTSGGNNVLYGDTNRSPYTDDANNLIKSDVVDLSGLSANDLPTINFTATCDTEYSTGSFTDYLLPKISSDSVNYDTAIDSDGNPVAIDEYLIDALNGVEDPTGSKTYNFTDLPLASKYLNSNFSYGFRWITNGTDNNHDGCYISKFSLNKIGNGSGDGTNNNNYEFWDGTSMAAPFVAGTAALALSYDSHLSAEDLKRLISQNGDAVSGLTNKTISGNRLDAEKVLSTLRTSKKITNFRFNVEDGLAYNATVSGSDNTIEAYIPYSIKDKFQNKTLTATINFEGVSVAPDPATVHDYTSPVTFTVTAGDGTTQQYTVSAKLVPGIKDFKFNGSKIESTYFDPVELNEYIDISVPYGTNLKSLAPVITTDNGQGGSSPVSPQSGVVNDFSDHNAAVYYDVTYGNFSTRYIVNVWEAPGITNFSFNGVNSAINHVSYDSNGTGQIYVDVPYGTDIRNLTSNIQAKRAGGISQNVVVSSQPTNDFTNPVKFTVSDQTMGFSDHTFFSKDYFVHVNVKDNPFSKSDVVFKDLSSKRTTDQTKVKVKFEHVGNAVAYEVSRSSDFEGERWESMDDGINLKLRKTDKKQAFYIRFKDADGVISSTEKKTVQYVPSERVIKNSISSVPKGNVLVQSGKNFSANSKVALYFSKADGSFYPPIEVTTDSKGAFSVSFKANKPIGTYTWYAVDLKTSKQSKKIHYKVR